MQYSSSELSCEGRERPRQWTHQAPASLAAGKGWSKTRWRAERRGGSLPSVLVGMTPELS